MQIYRERPLLEYERLRSSHVVFTPSLHMYYDIPINSLLIIREVASAPRCDPGGEPARAARKSRTLGHLRSQNSNNPRITEIGEWEWENETATGLPGVTPTGNAGSQPRVE